MKSFMTFKKYSLLAASMFLASAVVISCDEEDPDGPTVFDGTILELLDDDQYKQAVNGDPLKSFDSLYKYLSLHPELTAVAGGSTDITLFAPNNTAFVNLLATPGFPAKISQISTNVIKGVLSYHIVAGQALMKADLTPTGTGAGFNSAFTQPNNCNPAAAGTVQVIKVNANGTLLTGSSNKDLDILTADLVADNGVVHIVESVLIPPSVEASLTPILGRISGTVLLGGDFTYLAAIITYADCGKTAEETALAAILTGAATSPTALTAFLPVNAYFTAPTTSGGLGYTSVNQAIAAMGTAAQARLTILNHIVATGSFNTTALATGGNRAAMSQVQLSFTGGLFPGTTTQTLFVKDVDCTNSGAPIASANIAHSNGTAHAIFGYLPNCAAAAGRE